MITQPSPNEKKQSSVSCTLMCPGLLLYYRICNTENIKLPDISFLTLPTFVVHAPVRVTVSLHIGHTPHECYCMPLACQYVEIRSWVPLRCSGANAQVRHQSNLKRMRLQKFT